MFSVFSLLLLMKKRSKASFQGSAYVHQCKACRQNLQNHDSSFCKHSAGIKASSLTPLCYRDTEESRLLLKPQVIRERGSFLFSLSLGLEWEWRRLHFGDCQFYAAKLKRRSWIMEIIVCRLFLMGLSMITDRLHQSHASLSWGSGEGPPRSVTKWKCQSY